MTFQCQAAILFRILSRLGLYLSQETYDVIRNHAHSVMVAVLYSVSSRVRGRDQITQFHRLHIEIHFGKTVIHAEAVFIVGKVHTIIQFLQCGVPVHLDIFRCQRSCHYFRYRQIYIRQEEITADICLCLTDLLQCLSYQVADIQESSAAGSSGDSGTDMHGQFAIVAGKKRTLHFTFDLVIQCTGFIHQQESTNLTDTAGTGGCLIDGNMFVVQPV